MKVVVWIVAVLVLLGGVVFGVGALLPVEHTASVRAVLPAPRDSVFAVLADVESAPSWRSDLDSTRILSESPVRWTEYGEWGTMTFARFIEVAPGRLGTRIEDSGGPFGGLWVYGLEDVPEGTRLTILEQGEVYSPAFRFMSRFVFGHHSTMEAVMRDLGRHFGVEDIEIERLETEEAS